MKLFFEIARLRAIWFWSWFCWALAVYLPRQWNCTRLGHALLPWAGLYGFTDGGWAEFKREYPARAAIAKALNGAGAG